MFAVCLVDTKRERIPRGTANGSRDCGCNPICNSRAGKENSWRVICPHVPKSNGATLMQWMLYKQRSKRNFESVNIHPLEKKPQHPSILSPNPMSAPPIKMY